MPFNPAKLEEYETVASNLLKKLGLKDHADLGGTIAVKAGMAGLWPLGSYATDKVVASQEDKLTDTQQKMIRFAGNMAFGAPILFHAMGQPFWEDSIGKVTRNANGKLNFEKVEWADATMSGLSLGIGAAGVAYNNREFMSSAAMLGFLFELAGNIEEYIEKKGQEGMEALKDVIPESMKYKVKGVQDPVSHDKIAEGQIVHLQKGDIVPVDGNLFEADKGAFVDSLHILDGDADQTRTFTEGQKIVQGLEVDSPVKIKALADSEGSHIGKLAEEMEEEVSAKRHSSIRNIVNKGYVPLMLAVVATQFGLRFYNDRKKHLNRADFKDRQVHQAIDESREGERDPFEVAKLQEEATAYRAEKTPGHSFQQSIERSTDLAIKMAPCAIMAALLMFSFTRSRLVKKNILINKEAGLEYSGEAGRNLGETRFSSDLRGPIVKHDGQHVQNPVFYRENGDMLDAGSEQAQNLLRQQTTLQENSTHTMGKTWASHAKKHDIEKCGGTFESLDLNSDHGRGRKGKIRSSGRPTEIIAGNRRALEDNGYTIPDALQNKIREMAKKNELDDFYIVATKKGSNQPVFGLMPLKVDYVEETVPAIQDLVRKGAEFEIVTGSSNFLGKTVVKRLQAGLPEAAQKRISYKAERSPAEKAADIKSQAGEKKYNFFIADDPNDVPAIKAISDIGGHAITVGEPSIGATKRAASMVLPGINKIAAVMDLGRQVSRHAMINTALAGTYVAGLTGHHLGGTYLYHQERLQRQKLLEEGKSPEEINDIIAANKTGWHSVFEKQPSTVVSSVLHEAPTVAMAGYSGWKSAELLRSVAQLGK